MWAPCYFAFQSYGYSLHVVDGLSMQPTFNPTGEPVRDRVVVERWRVRALALLGQVGRYSRGDVVLLRAPDRPGEYIIKRLVALEGDWLYVPGRVDVEKIPKGHCWVEGDNVALSADSRTRYGPVPLSLVEGRARVVFWPPWRSGRVAAGEPIGRLLVRNPRAISRARDDCS
ncbi:hypothetical protein WJX81_005897 [Elliptochloris bilobata]|uniref:Mitochondrial inner membrane protease subunit 2 n=1 Tax=Elliptochloris bilobata TaxID=381761 RepID=A0AAW1SLR7_9CHLO